MFLLTLCVGTDNARAFDTWGPILLIGLIYYGIAILSLHMILFPVTGSVGDGGIEIGENVESTADFVIVSPIRDSGGGVLSVNGIESVDKEIDSESVMIIVAGVTLSVRTNGQENKEMDSAEISGGGEARKKLLLRNVHAQIEASKLTALMGSSGSG